MHIVGQGIAFDVNFIERAMKDFDMKPTYDRRKLDTASLAWFHIKDCLNSMSLEKLCEHFHISNVGQHGALVDCRRTFELYLVLKGQNK